MEYSELWRGEKHCQNLIQYHWKKWRLFCRRTCRFDGLMYNEITVSCDHLCRKKHICPHSLHRLLTFPQTTEIKDSNSNIGSKNHENVSFVLVLQGLKCRDPFLDNLGKLGKINRSLCNDCRGSAKSADNRE